MTEEIVVGTKQAATAWNPELGPETEELLQSLKKVSEKEKLLLVREAIRVLSRCGPSNCQSTNGTGLVVGYVQSGKTMSFTTLAALARDNGFRIIIVIAGTSIPLFEQSAKRLKRDLRIEDRDDRAWQVLENPEVKQTVLKAMADALQEWHEDIPKHELKTLLIVVMKHHGRLQQLATLMQALELNGAPILIIDDEADQASMNAAVRDNAETTTYARLKALRKAIPCHSFVQYTATPQAPLLINIIDILSPDFAEVLTAGNDYVGGMDFFGEHSNLIKPIPSEDIVDLQQVPENPPKTLLEAMRLFFIGVAAGIINEGSKGNRSMMVHPSQRVDSHKVFYNWIAATKQEWKHILSQPGGDADRKDLLEEFAAAHADIEKTTKNLPTFDKVIERLPHAINRTTVDIVNAATGKTPPIDWKGSYPHILVGGQAMDRGFTVEGLTVTYMPRSVGVGNADTIQQRARFFGYKRPYLGYCRVFLEPGARDAYRKYVAHEQDMRQRLEAHSHTNSPLSEWKREFFLTSSLKPTRDTVLSLDYMRISFASKWFVIKAPHDDSNAAVANWKTVAQFVDAHQFNPDVGHKERTEIQRHKVAKVPLTIVIKDLLEPFKATRPADSQAFTSLRIQLLEMAEADPTLICTVYQMSSGAARVRSVTDHDEIENLFQGANPDKSGTIYPGDQKIVAADVTVQIHNVTLRDANKNILAEKIPTLAIRMPPGKGEDLYIQLSTSRQKR